MSVRLSANDKLRLLQARGKIIRWFSRYGRSFFWRKIERNPYRVLVTEFMLQQTQTFRVEEFLPRFLQRFPNVKALANAESGDVIKEWQGLGYNRRALNLHKTAQTVAYKFQGVFPTDDEMLLSLPGVGQYTMRALQVFAFGRRVSVVDVNVVRVISRLTKKMRSTNEVLPADDVHTINTILLPRSADKWHEALMDLGATICKAKPVCAQCPVKNECASFATLSSAKHLPVKKNPNERIYFGKPKRIWRGVILKTVATHNTISLRALERTLTSHSTQRSPEFSRFISETALELVAEGLCRRRGSYLTIQPI